MSDPTSGIPSRRAKREALEAEQRTRAALDSLNNPPETDLAFSRRDRRRVLESSQALTGSPDTASIPVPINPPEIPVTRPATVGSAPRVAQTLNIDRIPSSQLSGPIGQTGEIILTGPIERPPVVVERVPTGVMNLGVGNHVPAIPRRATEALSIIGRSSVKDEGRRTRSVGQGVSAGIAAFLGLVVLTVVVIALYLKII